MIRFQPYKQLHKLLENENYEPLFSWGLRMAIAGTVPVIWGVATDQMALASWVTITAECICWVELKGSFPQRLRVLAGGAVLALLFCVIGSITGVNIWMSAIAMAVVGFLAGLFKNLGDRGAGLAVCVQVMFVISNAYPTHTAAELQERLSLVLLGGGWTLLTGLVASVFIPARQPYRRTIALIWRDNARLMATVAKGWDGRSVRSSARDIYDSEKQIRLSLDNSFHFFETMAHQVSKDQNASYQLAQLRKASALVASNIISISDELEHVRIRDLQEELRVKLSDTLRALEQTLDRMGYFVVSLRAEEELLINSRLLRLEKFITLLKEHEQQDGAIRGESLHRIIQLLERTVKFIQASLRRIGAMGEDLAVFRSYSLIKTLFVLHPKHWYRNLRLLFNFNTGNARYAFRSALAASIGVVLYRWLDIEHGYWLPFTALIVIQPYFTATLKKAIDRVVGTLTGGVVGGLLVWLPTGTYAKELMLFVCSLFMVWFIRRQYAVAVFFITVSVVLLFDVEEIVDPALIATRAVCTVAGAVLGIFAGFALLPVWDRKRLPMYLSEALDANYRYFLATFYSTGELPWTRYKRGAETKNSNVFDSFSRYMQEPGRHDRKDFMAWYQLINHSVRITRELNNVHLEREQEAGQQLPVPADTVQPLIDDCLHWFHKNLEALGNMQGSVTDELYKRPEEFRSPLVLTVYQKISLDKLLIELKAMNEDLVHSALSSRIPAAKS